MDYTNEIVRGYDFLTKLNQLRRRASDAVSELVAGELDTAVNCLEDSLFYLEDIGNVHGSLDECLDSSRRYIGSLRSLQQSCSGRIEKNLLRDAIDEAEESAALLEDIKDMVDGYESY